MDDRIISGKLSVATALRDTLPTRQAVLSAVHVLLVLMPRWLCLQAAATVRLASINSYQDRLNVSTVRRALSMACLAKLAANLVILVTSLPFKLRLYVDHV